MIGPLGLGGRGLLLKISRDSYIIDPGCCLGDGFVDVWFLDFFFFFFLRGGKQSCTQRKVASTI